MIIKSILLNRLRNAGLVQFFTDVDGIVAAALTGSALMAVGEERTAFLASKAALSQNYQLDATSPLTQEVLNADVRRDDAVTGIRLLAEGYAHHFNNDKRMAGQRLMHAISIYGEVIAKAYQDETAAITNLLEDFDAKQELVDAIGTLELGEWKGELKVANLAFNQKYGERTAATAAADTGTNIVELRKPAINAWYALRDQIAANYTVTKGAAPWSTVVAQLNALIDQYNATLARRGGSSDDDDGTPPQNFPGS